MLKIFTAPLITLREISSLQSVPKIRYIMCPPPPPPLKPEEYKQNILFLQYAFKYSAWNLYLLYILCAIVFAYYGFFYDAADV
jgi:hypothetical protein